MERCLVMTEEQITKILLKELITFGWKIVCFDFPQSGTGVYIHPNITVSKNLNSFIPDIVAVKNNVCLFFENKDRYEYSDFKKVNKLILSDDYSEDISRLLAQYKIDSIYYGIGIPSYCITEKILANAYLVDFIIGVHSDTSISFYANQHNIIL